MLQHFVEDLEITDRHGHYCFADTVLEYRSSCYDRWDCVDNIRLEYPSGQSVILKIENPDFFYIEEKIIEALSDILEDRLRDYEFNDSGYDDEHMIDIMRQGL